MNTQQKQLTQSKSGGFTIIEVVLVLAIAGLIFVMVFLALPALQRGQRDTAAKQQVGNILSALTTYASNNRGSMLSNDGTSATSLASYLDGTAGSGVGGVATWPVSVSTFSIPTPTILTSGAAGTFSTALATNPFGNIAIYINATCNPATSNKAYKYQSRSYAVFTNLENGANSTDGTPYCQNT